MKCIRNKKNKEAHDFTKISSVVASKNEIGFFFTCFFVLFLRKAGVLF